MSAETIKLACSGCHSKKDEEHFYKGERKYKTCSSCRSRHIKHDALSTGNRKLYQREYAKTYYADPTIKVKQAEYMRDYNLKNKQHLKEYRKAYHLNRKKIAV